MGGQGDFLAGSTPAAGAAPPRDVAASADSAGSHSPSTALAAEATALLQRLIRFDTVNPPGAERAAILHLRDLLAGAGFECELLAAEPERPNLVARLRPDPAHGPSGAAGGTGTPGGAGDGGPILCYLGHVDTVLADPREWTHDPWSGDLADGFVWGRGALDMKSQVAAEVAAALSLAREGWRPARGELLVVAVVDEETGGELGAGWLCESHPEKVRCDMLLNEGGGPHFELDGRRCYPVCCAEKGVFRFTVATAGAAGHASMPALGDNALVKLAPVLQRFAARQPWLAPTPESLALLRCLGEDDSDPAAALARIGERDPALHTTLEPMFAVTFAPTRVSASEKINVIPSRAELRVDCRVPPGLGEAEACAAIERLLGDVDGLAIKLTEQITGNRSPMTSPLMDALSEWIARRDPEARAVPAIFPGFSDSHRFRAAFPDCVAYGFFPQRHQSLLEMQGLMHAPDERIDVRDLALATECYRDLAVRLLG